MLKQIRGTDVYLLPLTPLLITEIHQPVVTHNPQHITDCDIRQICMPPGGE